MRTPYMHTEVAADLVREIKSENGPTFDKICCGNPPTQLYQGEI